VLVPLDVVPAYLALHHLEVLEQKADLFLCKVLIATAPPVS
jgi:hypothetical protein